MPILRVGIVSATTARMGELGRVAAAITRQLVHDAQLLVTKTIASGFVSLHKTKSGKFIGFVKHTPKSLR
jgi:hypothetical protein